MLKHTIRLDKFIRGAGMSDDLGVERIVDCVPTIEKLLAENERLKAELENMTSNRDSEHRWANQYHAEAERMQAQVARYRSALNKYADPKNWQHATLPISIWKLDPLGYLFAKNILEAIDHDAA